MQKINLKKLTNFQQTKILKRKGELDQAKI